MSRSTNRDFQNRLADRLQTQSQTKSRKCTECGSTSFQEDDTGLFVCIICGTSLALLTNQTHEEEWEEGDDGPLVQTLSRGKLSQADLSQHQDLIERMLTEKGAFSLENYQQFAEKFANLNEKYVNSTVPGHQTTPGLHTYGTGQSPVSSLDLRQKMNFRQHFAHTILQKQRAKTTLSRSAGTILAPPRSTFHKIELLQTLSATSLALQSFTGILTAISTEMVKNGLAPSPLIPLTNRLFFKFLAWSHYHGWGNSHYSYHPLYGLQPRGQDAMRDKHSKNYPNNTFDDESIHNTNDLALFLENGSESTFFRSVFQRRSDITTSGASGFIPPTTFNQTELRSLSGEALWERMEKLSSRNDQNYHNTSTFDHNGQYPSGNDMFLYSQHPLHNTSPLQLTHLGQTNKIGQNQQHSNPPPTTLSLPPTLAPSFKIDPIRPNRDILLVENKENAQLSMIFDFFSPVSALFGQSFGEDGQNDSNSGQNAPNPLQNQTLEDESTSTIIETSADVFFHYKTSVPDHILRYIRFVSGEWSTIVSTFYEREIELAEKLKFLHRNGTKEAKTWLERYKTDNQGIGYQRGSRSSATGNQPSEKNKSQDGQSQSISRRRGTDDDESDGSSPDNGGGDDSDIDHISSLISSQKNCQNKQNDQNSLNTITRPPPRPFVDLTVSDLRLAAVRDLQHNQHPTSGKKWSKMSELERERVKLSNFRNFQHTNLMLQRQKEWAFSKRFIYKQSINSLNYIHKVRVMKMTTLWVLINICDTFRLVSQFCYNFDDFVLKLAEKRFGLITARKRVEGMIDELDLMGQNWTPSSDGIGGSHLQQTLRNKQHQKYIKNSKNDGKVKREVSGGRHDDADNANIAQFTRSMTIQTHQSFTKLPLQLRHILGIVVDADDADDSDEKKNIKTGRQSIGSTRHNNAQNESKTTPILSTTLPLNWQSIQLQYTNHAKSTSDTITTSSTKTLIQSLKTSPKSSQKSSQNSRKSPRNKMKVKKSLDSTDSSDHFDSDSESDLFDPSQSSQPSSLSTSSTLPHHFPKAGQLSSTSHSPSLSSLTTFSIPLSHVRLISHWILSDLQIDPQILVETLVQNCNGAYCFLLYLQGKQSIPVNFSPFIDIDSTNNPNNSGRASKKKNQSNQFYPQIITTPQKTTKGEQDLDSLDESLIGCLNTPTPRKQPLKTPQSSQKLAQLTLARLGSALQHIHPVTGNMSWTNRLHSPSLEKNSNQHVDQFDQEFPQFANIDPLSDDIDAELLRFKQLRSEIAKYQIQQRKLAKKRAKKDLDSVLTENQQDLGNLATSDDPFLFLSQNNPAVDDDEFLPQSTFKLNSTPLTPRNSKRTKGNDGAGYSEMVDLDDEGDFDLDGNAQMITQKNAQKSRTSNKAAKKKSLLDSTSSESDDTDSLDSDDSLDDISSSNLKRSKELSREEKDQENIPKGKGILSEFNHLNTQHKLWQNASNELYGSETIKNSPKHRVRKQQDLPLSKFHRTNQVLSSFLNELVHLGQDIALSAHYQPFTTGYINEDCHQHAHEQSAASPTTPAPILSDLLLSTLIESAQQYAAITSEFDPEMSEMLDFIATFNSSLQNPKPTTDSTPPQDQFNFDSFDPNKPKTSLPNLPPKHKNTLF